jgi:hypothetical protein
MKLCFEDVFTNYVSAVHQIFLPENCHHCDDTKNIPSSAVGTWNATLQARELRKRGLLSTRTCIKVVRVK